MSGGQPYSPHNYDERYEGMITLRRALAGSRNVPAVKLADKIGITSVVDMARRFGITSPLPPYLPITLGAADLNLMEHASAFTVFPDDGIRIDAHLIRRVTTYDGAVLEEARPAVHDVISPEVARTMVAMLEDVVNFGTGVGAKALGRPSAGKTGTTNDFTDAWFMGFTPQLTAGVWVGFDDKQKSLGTRRDRRARRAADLARVHAEMPWRPAPVEKFPNVEPLEKIALTKQVKVDTPDSAPTEGSEEGRGTASLRHNPRHNPRSFRSPSRRPRRRTHRQRTRNPRRILKDNRGESRPARAYQGISRRWSFSSGCRSSNHRRSTSAISLRCPLKKWSPGNKDNASRRDRFGMETSGEAFEPGLCGVLIVFPLNQQLGFCAGSQIVEREFSIVDRQSQTDQIQVTRASPQPTRKPTHAPKLKPDASKGTPGNSAPR